MIMHKVAKLKLIYSFSATIIKPSLKLFLKEIWFSITFFYSQVLMNVSSKRINLEMLLIKVSYCRKLNHTGPSPDEITLVDAAAHMGFKFEGASASE